MKQLPKSACIAFILAVGASLVLLSQFYTPRTKHPAATPEDSPEKQTGTAIKPLNPGWIKEHDPASWMSSFYDRGLEHQLKLTDICLPATHDSAAYGVIGGIQQFASPWVITQDLNIGEQLRAGARKLDLRVMSVSEKEASNRGITPGYYIHHGGFITAPLDEVINDLSTYFGSKEATNETLICQFTHFRGFDQSDNSITMLARHLAKKLKPYLFTKQAGESMMLLPLKRFQGKIIILFGSQAKPLPDGVHQLNAKESIITYNRYANKDQAQTMIDDQGKKFSAFKNDQTFFLLNWTLTPRPSGGIPRSVKSLAAKANAKLIRHFTGPTSTFGNPNNHGKIVNAINVDFFGTVAPDTLRACEQVMSQCSWAKDLQPKVSDP